MKAFTKHIQAPFLFLLNAIGTPIQRIDERIRDIIIQVLWILIGIYFVIVRSKGGSESFLWKWFPTIDNRHSFLCVLILLIAVLSINGKLKPVPWRCAVVVPQFILGVGILAISFLHPIGAGYQLFSIQLLVVFPIFYLVWNNRRDYSKMIRPIVLAMSVVGILFFLYSLKLACSGDLVFAGHRCRGIMVNSNCFSLVGLDTFLSGIYLLTTERPSKIKTVLCASLIGTGLSTVIQGKMRASIVLVLICSFITAYYYFRFLRGPERKKYFLRILNGVLIFLLVTEIGLALDNINSKAKAIKKNKTVQEEQSKKKTQEPKEDIKDAVDRILPTNDADINDYSSGRIKIWSNYAKNLNMLGNNYDEYIPEEMTGRADLPYAHNLFLEVAYRCGIPLGIVYVVLIVMSGLVCIRMLFSRMGSKKAYHLFPIICVIVFTLEALIDCAALPFQQIEDLTYFVSIAVLADYRE